MVRMSVNADKASKPTVWVINTHLRGEMNARLGVAEKLGYPYEIVDIPLFPHAHERIRRGEKPAPNESFDDTMGYLKKRFGAHFQNAAWPDVVITSSTHHTEIGATIKRLSKGKTFTVNIHLPQNGYYDEFDLIAVPDHIPVPYRPNILQISGIPHRVTGERLQEGAKEWGEQLNGLKKPVLAVLVGGNSQEYKFSPEDASALAKKIKAIHATHSGSVIVTNSPRSPEESVHTLMNELGASNHVYFHDWRRDDGNPYYGILAKADAFIVTGDSMTMCHEAATTGKPVYVYSSAACDKKFAPFHERLYQTRQARPLQNDHSLRPWSRESIDAAGEVAQEIRSRLHERSRQVHVR